MNKHWKEFMKSGKISDYLKYKEEIASEIKKEVKDGQKGSSSTKNN